MIDCGGCPWRVVGVEQIDVVVDDDHVVELRVDAEREDDCLPESAVGS